jgi:hypothetical protein
MTDLFIQTAAHGIGKAARLPRCLMSPDVRDVLDAYDRLKTDEARAAFADKYLSLLSRRLDDTWPVIYELLALVRDRELFKGAGDLGRGKTFASFDAYFVDTIGKPFETWVELEKTYQFVSECQPALVQKTFAEARTALQERMRDAAGNTTGSVLPRAVGVNQHTSPESLAQIEHTGQEARAERNGISRTQQQKLDALARRAPELLERVRRGEVSTHRACVEAGIVKEPSSYELLCRAWKKASHAEKDRFMAEKNQEGW